MRSNLLVVGYGNQGQKRSRLLSEKCNITSVDPNFLGADFGDIKELDLGKFSSAFLCVPDRLKLPLLRIILPSIKRVLVEKPLPLSPSEHTELAGLCTLNNAKLYIAYNHRFEPGIVDLKAKLDELLVKNIYKLAITYANGTARDVRDSVWKDTGLGVIEDLGSHVFDTINFLFGKQKLRVKHIEARSFENRAPDNCTFIAEMENTQVTCELSFLSWRNDFSIDIFTDIGTFHAKSLCKWGPASSIHRKRILPSGKPDETRRTFEIPDPTWDREHSYFFQNEWETAQNLADNQWVNHQIFELKNALTESKR